MRTLNFVTMPAILNAYLQQKPLPAAAARGGGLGGGGVVGGIPTSLVILDREYLSYGRDPLVKEKEITRNTPLLPAQPGCCVFFLFSYGRLESLID